MVPVPLAPPLSALIILKDDCRDSELGALTHVSNRLDFSAPCTLVSLLAKHTKSTSLGVRGVDVLRVIQQGVKKVGRFLSPLYTT